MIAEAPLGTHPELPRIWLAHSGEPEVGATLTDRFGLRAVRALAFARDVGLPGPGADGARAGA